MLGPTCSQFLVTLDDGYKQNGAGWPLKTMRNSSIEGNIESVWCGVTSELASRSDLWMSELN